MQQPGAVHPAGMREPSSPSRSDEENRPAPAERGTPGSKRARRAGSAEVQRDADHCVSICQKGSIQLGVELAALLERQGGLERALREEQVSPSLFGRCLLEVAEADWQATLPPTGASQSAHPAEASPRAEERARAVSPRRALALAFKLNTRPSATEISALGEFLRLEDEAVAAWFARRRQLEVWAREAER